eukprot:1540317-Pyramimonas_sp.AAC.1
MPPPDGRGNPPSAECGVETPTLAAQPCHHERHHYRGPGEGQEAGGGGQGGTKKERTRRNKEGERTGQGRPGPPVATTCV